MKIVLLAIAVVVGLAACATLPQTPVYTAQFGGNLVAAMGRVGFLGRELQLHLRTRLVAAPRP
jgi:hypothetical protein